MTQTLSPNTQAILLLTAPLLAGRGATTRDLLTPGEYKRLARHLREIQCQPADLISPETEEVLLACQHFVDLARLRHLLGRGFLLSQVIERWQARAIWVISRADADYPSRLKTRLHENAPAVLYGCGDIGLLGTGGLAIVGSRHVDDLLIDYTHSVAALSARANKTVISGGAKGIDQAAMRGALEAGGNVCGVLADSLERTTMNRDHRNLILGDRLTLISPYDPNAGFNTGNAMQRNKLIYALADASLVVSSDLEYGGTWAGAIEQLDKLRFVPVYVRSTGERSAGLDALSKKGALAWPNPVDEESFEAVFSVPPLKSEIPTRTESTLFSYNESADNNVVIPKAPETAAVSQIESDAPAAAADRFKQTQDKSPEEPSLVTPPEPSTPSVEDTPAEALFAAVRESIRALLVIPMKDAEVAAALEVVPAQAKGWLQRLVVEGVLEKQKRPAGYVVKKMRLLD
jgi:DNA processing protein